MGVGDLCGTWALPDLGIKPVFPALAGQFFTTGPPGRFCVPVEWSCASPHRLPSSPCQFFFMNFGNMLLGVSMYILILLDELTVSPLLVQFFSLFCLILVELLFFCFLLFLMVAVYCLMVDFFILLLIFPICLHI